MQALRELIREIVVSLSEEPRPDPLITAYGHETRGPAAGAPTNAKMMVTKFHTQGDEGDDIEDDEEDDFV